MATALGALGWPILQAATSSVLGVLVLSTVHSYIIQTCFKTVFLVISCGTLHALLFLPVVLSVAHEAAIYVGSLLSLWKEPFGS